jgi:hypothetical protein
VTDTNDSGPGSLRQAILSANANPGPDTISFDLPAQSTPGLVDYDATYQVWRIQVDSPLPAITDQVNIDGYSQNVITGQTPGNEIQTVSLTGLPTGGTFTLTFEGQTTAPIPYNATADQVRVALENLSTIGQGNIAASLGPVDTGLVSLTFQRALGETDVPQITGDGSGLITPPGLTGGVFTSTVANGVAGNITSDPNQLSVGFDAKVRVILEGGVPGSTPGTTVPSNFPGLTIQSNHNIIRGLSIDGFSSGITIQGPDAIGNLIQGNYLGQYVLFPNPILNAGTSAVGGIGNGVGVVIASPTNNTVGGVTPETHNGIAGNARQGVEILPGAEGNHVLGNTIGVLEQDATFYYQVGNGAEGVLVESSSNAIGGGVTGSTNVISANQAYGVHIVGPGAIDNRVESNYIGTDPNGTFKYGQGFPGNGQNTPTTVGNLRDGVYIDNAPDNIIGIPGGAYGTANAGGNIISGNFGAGVRIDGASATGNVVQGNLIGVDLSGSAALPNSQEGVVIDSADNTVGGTAPSGSNTISGNLRGVLITGATATGNVISGNRIGTDSKGAYDLGNSLEGVRIENASGNTLGGQGSAALNLISGNNVGVLILGASATENAVLGNEIGTDATGELSLGNSQQGVLIQGAPDNTIGGLSTAVRNVISGNHWGVTITGPTATGNLVQGNFIGTGVDGLSRLSNEVDGVLVDQNASENSIGGLAVGAGNTIAFNLGTGVVINSGNANAILSNAIYANTKLGIDLGDDGVTPNHPGGSTSGPNNLENYPVLTFVAPTGNSTNVQGTFNSTPNSIFTLQFFSSATKNLSGFGQGQTLLGSASVTTDASGNASFNLNVPVVVPSGQFVAATATDAGNDTSEFSNSMPSVPVSVQLGASTYFATESGPAATITVTRTGGTGGQVIVNLATGGGTAVAGTDYTAVNTPVIFNPGQTSKTVTIPILDPHKVGTSTTVGLTLSNPTNGATLGTPSTATLTINDNEPETFQFAVSTFNVTENAGAVTLTVIRNTGNGTASVTYATGGGSAIPGVDYSPVFARLTFAPGQTSQTFQVPIIANHRIEGASIFGLALVNPSGAILGAPSTATITIAAHQQVGAFALSAPTYAASAGSNSVTVAVTRVGGAEGQATVHYATAGGNAQPGVDYTPVSGTLTFGPGVTVKTITIPVAPNRLGNAVAFAIALSQPNGGPSLGSPAASAVVVPGGGSAPIRNGNGGPGPTVQGLSLVDGPTGITEILVQFNGPMDPIRADNVANYGYFVVSAGGDGIFGTGDDFSVSLKVAAYDPSSTRTILIPAAPLPFNVVYQITLNQFANPLLRTGLTDTAGNLLDGDANGVAGGAYVARFGQGSSLRYTDASGNLVALQLNRGLLDLRLSGNGAAQSLRLESTTPGKSVLSGTARPLFPGSSGHTILPTINGALGVKIQLKPQQFSIGSIFAAAVNRSGK